jgi:hypothetical protein
MYNYKFIIQMPDYLFNEGKVSDYQTSQKCALFDFFPGLHFLLLKAFR